MSSYLFKQSTIDKSANNYLLDMLEVYANTNKIQIYALSTPLSSKEYKYKYKQGIIILSPKSKIAFIDMDDKSKYKEYNDTDFTNYVNDVLEDIGVLSDLYNYKEKIGRIREWKNELVKNVNVANISDAKTLFGDILKLDVKTPIRLLELVVSLFIGSINDIKKIEINKPSNDIDIVKNKIQLFDEEQTTFIYDVKNEAKKRITIQGLSGTGKTELLLHKLKDLYVRDENSRIYFTCHNKILANELRTRIPKFFNFMKVDQQIEWNTRFWCNNAWGRFNSPESGLYSYICNLYNLPFYSYSPQNDFSNVCKIAYNQLKDKKESLSDTQNWYYAFTYILVDESQDFDEYFFKLCEIVTEKTIYIAGDIFQSIFEDSSRHSIMPDYLLRKCYRTDPKTLMFAHALGMGLFEKQKLWWLEKDEWEKCGYEVKEEDGFYDLTREPIRRFEDIDENYDSIKISTNENLIEGTIDILKQIKDEYSTVHPDDIGIIILDTDKSIYDLMNLLEKSIIAQLNISVNLAYVTKNHVENQIFLSNINNVKGLEFPFVICVTKELLNTRFYRSAVYTMLTRSFLRSYLLINKQQGESVAVDIRKGFNQIKENKVMRIKIPNDQEKQQIKAQIKLVDNLQLLSDNVNSILEDLEIAKDKQSNIRDTLSKMVNLKNDKEILRKLISALNDSME